MIVEPSCLFLFSSVIEHEETRRGFLKLFGTDEHFLWRISDEEIGTVSNVLLMRKHEQWRENLSRAILRFAEGHLVSTRLVEMVNPYFSHENRNPHR